MNITFSETLKKLLLELEEDSGMDKETLRNKLGIDNNVLTGYLNEIDGVLIVKERTGRTKGETIRKTNSEDKINTEKLKSFNNLAQEFEKLARGWSERSHDWKLILEAYSELSTKREQQVINLFEFTSTFYTQVWFDISKFYLFKAHEKDFPLIAQDIKAWLKERASMFEDITDFITFLQKEISGIVFTKSFLKMENCSMIQIGKMYAVDRKSNF